MVPRNHIQLLIADGRRAKSWELGLRRAGLSGHRIETRGSDAAKGDYWITVPTAQRSVGQRFVSDVLAGKIDLPRVSPLSRGLLWGAAFIVGSMVALAIAALATR